MRRLSIVLILAFSTTAGAQGFDYNYAQISYGSIDFDSINVNADGDGLGLFSSFAINSNWHGFAAYQNTGVNFGYDLNAFGAGVGYNTD